MPKKDYITTQDFTKEELLNEIRERWKKVQSFPIPSNVSKHALARDLALAKGFDLSKLNKISKTNELDSKQREF